MREQRSGAAAAGVTVGSGDGSGDRGGDARVVEPRGTHSGLYRRARCIVSRDDHRVPTRDGRDSVSVWLVVGIVLYLAGLALTFSGAGLGGRVIGLAVVSAGAGLAVVFAPPLRSWPAAITVALTLIPLVLVAAALRRKVDQVAGERGATLDDDAL